MQAMGNTYYAFVNLADFQGWIELFGLVDAELIQQKRILPIVSGAILPIVALGFIKSFWHRISWSWHRISWSWHRISWS
jgi:hypothetical protein